MCVHLANTNKKGNWVSVLGKILN